MEPVLIAGRCEKVLECRRPEVWVVVEGDCSAWERVVEFLRCWVVTFVLVGHIHLPKTAVEAVADSCIDDLVRVALGRHYIVVAVES